MLSRFSPTTAMWTLILFVLWVVLSESLNPFHLGVGAVAALAVSLLNPSLHARRSYSLRWPSALTYFPMLFVRILVSGLRLSYLILHPSLPIKPRLFRYPTTLADDAAIMLLGNSITLTPGTVTVEAKADELTVHAIDGDAEGELALQPLERAVAGVFQFEGEQR